MRKITKKLITILIIAIILLSTNVIVKATTSKPTSTFTSAMTEKQIADIINYYTQQ